MNINIDRLQKDELLKFKEAIEERLVIINDEESEQKIKLSKQNNKQSLSDLESDDLVLCIIFNGSLIYNMDYVNIKFDKPYNGYVTFSTNHQTKPMSCKSTIKEECLDKNYFLDEFPSHFYFITMKTDSWKEDLYSELERHIKLKCETFNAEVDRFKTNISSFINSNPKITC